MSALQRFRPAVDLLRELGITEPDEIDVEAIAQYCEATVLYEPLNGCEARIVGADDRAIITVNPSGSRGRQRFSAAHELAHWLRDAGSVAMCNPETAFDDSAGGSAETRANEYAADLLLPTFMFEPRSQGRPMTLETVSSLADAFQTSLTATAIRLVRYGSFPAVVLYTVNGQLKWFRRGPDVPQSLWPRTPGRGTFAFDLHQGTDRVGSGDVYAGEWFKDVNDRHRIFEDSRRSNQAVLTLLWWKDERPLEEIVEREERRASKRADWRDDD
jgi:hypothetical protein